MRSAAAQRGGGQATESAAAIRDPIDKLAVASLVAEERHWRDRGEWERMAQAYHPDCVVRLAWFEGTGTDFVAASRAGGRAGTTKHRLAPSIVRVNGDRAAAETSVVVETRTEQDGVEVDLFAYCRYVNRVRRAGGRWRLASVDCVCEKDTMRPVHPGDRIDIDAARLARYRPTYKFVSYNLASHGITPRDDLPGDDRPDLCRIVYAEAEAWLRT